MSVKLPVQDEKHEIMSQIKSVAYYFTVCPAHALSVPLTRDLEIGHGSILVCNTYKARDILYPPGQCAARIDSL
jgi:hypothetical protein